MLRSEKFDAWTGSQGGSYWDGRQWMTMHPRTMTRPTSTHSRDPPRKDTCPQPPTPNYVDEPTVPSRRRQEQLLHTLSEGPATKAYRLLEQRQKAYWKNGQNPRRQWTAAADGTSTMVRRLHPSEKEYSSHVSRQYEIVARPETTSVPSVSPAPRTPPNRLKNCAKTGISWQNPLLQKEIRRRKFRESAKEASCAESPFCLQCGGAGHASAVCPSDPERIAQLCLFCRKSDHSTKNCERAKKRSWVVGLPALVEDNDAIIYEESTRRDATPPVRLAPKVGSSSSTSEVAFRDLAEKFELMRDPQEDLLHQDEKEPASVKNGSLEKERGARPSTGRSILTRRSVADVPSPQSQEAKVVSTRKRSDATSPPTTMAASSVARCVGGRDQLARSLKSDIEQEFQAMMTRGGISDELRGINIPWPYSRFILDRTKTIDARRYSLGSYKKERLWLIETPGEPDDRMPNTTRPVKARIVGTIVFSHDRKYESEAMLVADADAHRIPLNKNVRKAKVPRKESSRVVRSGVCGWDGDCDQYAWYISHVRVLKYAVAGPTKKGIIGSRKCLRCVVFTDHTPSSESL